VEVAKAVDTTKVMEAAESVKVAEAVVFFVYFLAFLANFGFFWQTLAFLENFAFFLAFLEKFGFQLHCMQCIKSSNLDNFEGSH
jgi:hypothetical protein